MTNDRDRFPGLEKIAHELDRALLLPHRIGIHQTPGDEEGIKIVRLRVAEREIDIKLVAFLVVIDALHFAGLDRDDFCLRAGLIQSLARLGHFDLFKSIGDQDRHFFSA